MSLQDEIDAKAKTIHSDGYSMSIGEIASLYKDGELDIHPDFQRVFRWDITQKTRLIESILLGIPLPSIFVAQDKNGVWDVVDGLQRLSTIFEFMGILKDESGNFIPPSTLQGTEYLPHLKDKKWEPKTDEDLSNPENFLTTTQRLIIKRAKIDVKIINRESDADVKFELFQRLNTYGSSLTNQEIRNCLLVMQNKEKYDWLVSLAKDDNFQSVISLSEKNIDESYDTELAIRFIVYRYSEIDKFANTNDLNAFLTKTILSLFEKPDFDFKKEKSVFYETFSLLNKVMGEDSFKKYDTNKNRFVGPFSISAFECIIPGLSKNLHKYDKDNEDILKKKIQELWSNPEFLENSGAGKRISRIKKLIPLSEKIFG